MRSIPKQPSRVNLERGPRGLQGRPGVTGTATAAGSAGQLQVNGGTLLAAAQGFTYLAPGILAVGSATATSPGFYTDPNVQQVGFFGNPDPATTVGSGDFLQTGSATGTATSFRGGAIFRAQGGVAGGGFNLWSASAWGTTAQVQPLQLAAGYALSADGLATGSEIRLVAALALQNAPLTFHISNGGSGYTDGVYTDKSQLGIDLSAQSATGCYLALQKVVVSGGAVTQVVMNYSGSGSFVGDVLNISLLPPSYGGGGSGAQLTVDSVANSAGARITAYCATGSLAWQIGEHGEIYDGTGSHGNSTDLLSSQGFGQPTKYVKNPTPILAIDTIASGGSFTIANNTNIQLFTTTANLAAATVAMPVTPSDGQSVEFTFDHKVTALTVTATQTIENLPTRAMPGMPIRFIYYAASTTWKRNG